jgi:hypothetical protein
MSHEFQPLQPPPAPDMSPVILKPVASSQIAAIGYDSGANALSVLFKNRDGSAGSLYVYDSVSPDDHAALMSAESVGAHFRKAIKSHPDSYPFRKLDTARAFVQGDPA